MQHKIGDNTVNFRFKSLAIAATALLCATSVQALTPGQGATTSVMVAAMVPAGDEAVAVRTVRVALGGQVRRAEPRRSPSVLDVIDNDLVADTKLGKGLIASNREMMVASLDFEPDFEGAAPRPASLGSRTAGPAPAMPAFTAPNPPPAPPPAIAAAKPVQVALRAPGPSSVIETKTGKPIVFQVTPGSLKENLDTMLQELGWHRAIWTNTPGCMDWDVYAPFVVEAATPEEAVAYLVADYPVSVRMHKPDRAVGIEVEQSYRRECRS